MLPYQKDGKNLETLLEKLFDEDDELTSEGVSIMKKPVLPWPLGNCCSYNYAGF